MVDSEEFRYDAAANRLNFNTSQFDQVKDNRIKQWRDQEYAYDAWGNLARVPGTVATPHKGAGVHSNAYKQHVFDKLSAQETRADFLSALGDLKKSLSDGMLFKTAR